jgi:PilZ domain
VNSFVPRSTRYDLELPIRFFSTEGFVTGHLLNVSESGLLVKFDKSVEVWTVGEVSAYVTDVGDGYININARVSRIDNNREAALTFTESANDYPSIRYLVALAIVRSPLLLSGEFNRAENVLVPSPR